MKDIQQAIGAILTEAPRIARSLALGTLLAVIATFLAPRSYSVQLLLRPSASDGGMAGDLSSLAAQFGVNVGGASADNPAFYADVLRSRAVTAAVARRVRVVRDSVAVPLQDELEIESSGDSAADIERARRWIASEAVTVGVGRESGIVSVTVSTSDPTLSYAIAREYLPVLDSINTELRQALAAAELTYATQQAEEAALLLREAEDREAAFLSANRDYERSPQLRLAFARLSREVQLRQAVYTNVVQARESAKLASLRDTPRIAAIQAAEVPSVPDGRSLVVLSAIALLLSAMILAAAMTADLALAGGILPRSPIVGYLAAWLYRLGFVSKAP